MILAMELLSLPQEWMRGKCRRRSSRTCCQWTKPPNGPRFLVPSCASSPSDVAPFHGPLTWPSWMRRRQMTRSWKVGKGWRWPWKTCHKRSTEKETVASRFPAAVGAPSDSGWWLVQLGLAGKWIRTWSTSDQLSDCCEAWASWTNREWTWWCRFCNCPFCVKVENWVTERMKAHSTWHYLSLYLMCDGRTAEVPKSSCWKAITAHKLSLFINSTPRSMASDSVG